MKRGGWLLALGLVVAALAGQRLEACSFLPSPPREQLLARPTIYRARVIFTYQLAGGSGYRSLLRVTDVWKGESEALMWWNTGLGGGRGDCSWGYLKPGATTLNLRVYGSTPEETDALLRELYGEPRRPNFPMRVLGIPLLALTIGAVGIRFGSRALAARRRRKEESGGEPAANP